MKKRFLHVYALAAILAATAAGTAGQLKAQTGPIKVDINMSGRQDQEVTEPGYRGWFIDKSDTLVEGGVTFVVSKGLRGEALAGTWDKADVQAPHLAKFTCDGIFVKDGDFAQGSEIKLKITGLTPGRHTITTYHNITDNIPDVAEQCPIDIHVNGKEVVSNLAPTMRVLSIKDVAKANLEVDVAEGEDVEIRFIADTTGTQAVKNVYLNGFTVDAVNTEDMSNAPFPANKDEHVEVADNNLTLRWTPAMKAISQDLYIGKDSAAVANADHNSSLFMGNRPVGDSTYSLSDLYSMDKYYWRVDAVTADDVNKGDVWYFKTRQVAFPGAEGYGRFAIGGRGGKVVEVTNLNDDGPGSLRWAVTNDVGPRTIVFAVAGEIKLQSRLVLSQSHVTVAGETAPGGGITITRAPFGITGNDCIVRFMRVRIGGGTTYDGMGLTGANHSIMDHCSIAWTIDESFSSRGAHNITLQRTLIAEALNAAGHQNYPAGTQHGYAATIGGDIGSFHHNLLADCQGRNWSLGGGLDGNGYYTGRMDISNNVVYNWGHRATDGGAHEVNFVNNYYKIGGATNFFYAFNAQHEGVGKGMQRCYFDGNVMPGRFDETNQDKGRTASYSNGDTSSYETFVKEPFFPNYITLQSARDAYKSVLSDVGATVPGLDDQDIRVIQQTLDSTYSFRGSVTNLPGQPDNEADAGGFQVYPEVHRLEDWDTDHDGLPNWWESLKGLNPNSAAGDFSDSNADDDKDGYTNLEEYLQWLGTAHQYSQDKAAPVRVNLKALSRGYSLNPVYSITQQPANGNVQIVEDSIAVFTPTATTASLKALAVSSDYDMSAFSFKVVDAEGSTMERTVNIAMGVDQALAVRMADFQANRVNASEVKLNWETKTEINNNYFQVQKSSNPEKGFVNTGDQIKSKAVGGYSSAALKYQFTEQNSSLSPTYYRLLQVDNAGVETYSGVKAVAGASASAAIKLWPVPSNGKVFIDLGRVKGNTQMNIYDMKGILVHSEAVKGGAVKDINLPAKGVYVVKIIDTDSKQSIYQGKIIVK